MSYLRCWLSCEECGIETVESEFVRAAGPTTDGEVYAANGSPLLLGRAADGQLSARSRDFKPDALLAEGPEPEVLELAHDARSAVEMMDGQNGVSHVLVDSGRTEDATEQAEQQPTQQLQQQLTSQLSASERESLAAVRKELGHEGTEAVRTTLVPGELLDSCLLRFLRNQCFKPAPAANLLKAHAAWCQVERPAALADTSKEAIAGCPAELLDRYMPTWHQGFDRQGRPVIFSHYGKFRFKPILAAGVTVEKILQLHIRSSEQTARLCGEQTQKLGRDVSNSLIIMDTEGWDNANVRTKAAFDWVRGLAKIDQEHYVERMGQLFIINAPSSVHYFYKAACWMLPEKARNQVKIFSGRETWLPTLLELVDASELPPEYGGTGAPLAFLQGQ